MDSQQNPLLARARELVQKVGPAKAWASLASSFEKKTPFSVKSEVFAYVFKDWNLETQGPPPAWTPTPDEMKKTNLAKWMKELGHKTYEDLHGWSFSNRASFWEAAVKRLDVKFRAKPKTTLDPSGGFETPKWFVGAEMNIAESCFREADKDKPAIVFCKEGGQLQWVTYGELDRLSNRVANGLTRAGLKSGDRVAIDMTMTVEAVAIYLGTVKAGCAVVGIADSFAPDEIRTRLRIAPVRLVFTQDFIHRGGKKLPLYSRVVEAGPEKIVVVPGGDRLEEKLRTEDTAWNDFLSSEEKFTAVALSPHAPSNILFSSGTTGDPKAIPWSHVTPLKAAMDGHFHHDIQPGNVVAWPTNLGWMMGPWLIYASLVNRATIALFYGAPTGREFGEFIQNAKVQMLGLVPSLVKAWRQAACMEGLDWSPIKAFSSTGECSNADDYLYLMSLAGFRPVIEYCGGTEVGGGFLTGSLMQAQSPATFSTTSLGLEIEVLGEGGKPSKMGEIYLVPPSIGLSIELLNRDHREVYFTDTPKGHGGRTLRRHGDEVELLPKGYYRAHGRADDTMNLGGIKVSSVEIERVLNSVSPVLETAAIAMNPKGGGPSLLVIYAVLKSKVDLKVLKAELQAAIRNHLNPLYKIEDVVEVPSLPRTASNKVMRRVLRDQYAAK